MPKKPEADSYVEFVLEQLAPLGTITARSMMGGKTLYCHGTIFALIGHGAVYLKADDGNRPMFDARGLPAFRPDENEPGTMSYYLVPADVLENRDELARWATQAIAAGRRSASKKKRKK